MRSDQQEEVNDMNLLKGKRAQSTGEYAILFAIVLGAVIAIQGYVRNRIAGGIQNQANAYQTAVGGTLSGTFQSESQSATESKMASADAGVLGSKSQATSTTSH